jgi:hypothetical protein
LDQAGIGYEKAHNTMAMALKLRQTNVLELKLAA